MRFSLPQCLAYVHTSGGSPTGPLKQISHNAFFFKSKNPCKVGTLCMVKKFERVRKKCALEPLIRSPYKLWKFCKIVANDGQSQYNEIIFYRE